MPKIRLERDKRATDPNIYDLTSIIQSTCAGCFWAVLCQNRMSVTDNRTDFVVEYSGEYLGGYACQIFDMLTALHVHIKP